MPAATLLAVVAPSAGRAPMAVPLPTITVPKLDTNAARLAFALLAEVQCKGRLNFATERVAGAPPVGGWVSQSPGPGASIACDGRVTVDLSDGSIRPLAPVPALPVPPPVPVSSMPALPPPWRMPDITLAARLADLQRDAFRRCRSLLRYEDRSEASVLRQGTILGQEPAIGTPIGCSTRIALIRASAMPPVGLAVSTADPASSAATGSPSPSSARGAAPAEDEVPAGTPSPDRLDVSAWLASSRTGWLAAALVVLLALAALIARARLSRPRAPAPRLEAGTAIASAAPVPGGPGAALPLIALETGAAAIAVAFPEGIPVEAVETGSG